MKVEQLELALEAPKKIPQLKDLAFGEACIVNKRVVIRVKPTGFLLNSTVIQDIINRGDVFVFYPKVGTMYPMLGTTECEPVSAKIVWSKEVSK